jgi:hypothetical protein
MSGGEKTEVHRGAGGAAPYIGTLSEPRVVPAAPLRVRPRVHWQVVSSEPSFVRQCALPATARSPGPTRPDKYMLLQVLVKQRPILSASTLTRAHLATAIRNLYHDFVCPATATETPGPVRSRA